MRYVKDIVDHGILFEKDVSCEMVAYCNVDCASDYGTRRSTISYMFSLGSRIVSWCTKRQPTVSLSSKEAEYGAVASLSGMCVVNAIAIRFTLTN